MTTATKSRPILFSGAMVRAILDGRKTQTRRVVKGIFDHTYTDGVTKPSLMEWDGLPTPLPGGYEKTPFGQPGDELWVREAFALQCRNGRFDLPAFESETWSEETNLPSLAYGCHLYHRATDEEMVRGRFKPEAIKWRPSIFMPRWACRIELVVKDVRVERLWDLSEADSLAEGVSTFHAAKTLSGCPLYSFDPDADPSKHYTPEGETSDTARVAFERGWDSLNAKRGFGWDVNPWVWVVEFERKEGAQAS